MASADGEVVWSWRPDAGVKSCGAIRMATVARKPVTGESSKEAVKPLRREGRIASAEPVCSCAFSSVHFAHETAGAARTRSSLRPLLLRGPKVTQTSDASRRENTDAYLSQPSCPATRPGLRPAGRKTPAGHPVIRGVSGRAERPQRTGCLACAGYDSAVCSVKQ
jgi:hypothetical protein